MSFVIRASGVPAFYRAVVMGVVGAALVFVALVGGSSPARAAVIPGAITSIQTTATSTDQYDQVDFTCQWAVPDGAAPGDTFALQLPPELRWSGAATFSLLSQDAQAVATARVSSGGLVTFTLTSYVASHSTNVHGTCRFSTLYTATTSGGAVNLDFRVGSSVIRVPLDTGQPCTQDCGPDRTVASKAMWWTDGQQRATQTVVRAPATTAQTTSVVITDVPGAGLTLDCATLLATIGRVLDADNAVTDPTDDTAYPATVSCTPQGATASWANVPAGEYAELWVEAAVTDPSLTDYTNRGSVTLNGVEEPVQGHVVRTDASGTGSGVVPTPSPTTTAPSPTTTAPSPTTTAPSPTTTAPSPTTTAPSPTTTAPSPTTTAAPVSSTTPVGGSTVAVHPQDASAAARPSSLAFTGATVARTAAAGLGAILLGLALQLTFRRRSR